MVSTPQIFIYIITISPGPTIIVKQCSERKKLRLFTEVLDFKKKTSVLRVSAAESKRKAMRAGSMLWSSIPNRKGHTKINEQVRISLYNFILQHPQAVQSPIAHDCLKVSIDGNSESQLVSKLLLQVSFWEPHNIMVSPPEEGVLNQAIDIENNIIISDSTLRYIIPPQLNNMYAGYKVMCGCE